MSPILGSAGLRGARFKAVFARSSYVGIGWNLWGFLPHFLPQHRRVDPDLPSIAAPMTQAFESLQTRPFWRANLHAFRNASSRVGAVASPTYLVIVLPAEE
jgi:hypothetical protein